MHSQPWRIRSNERITAVGKTRVGKTTAVKKLVWSELDNVIFYDVKKREYKDLNAPILTSLDEAKEALFPDDPREEVRRFIFAGPSDRDTLDKLCQYVLAARNQHLIIDELLSVYHGNTRPTKYHNKLTVEGGGVGCGVTNCTQRPKGVPGAALSEAEHIFTFYLRKAADRERMAELMGEIDEQNLKELDRYHFYYDHESFREAKRCEPLSV